MIHIFKNKKSKKVIITLHGTGSNENEFLPIGEKIDSNASILSIRGNVNENGMLRYFERFGMGLYNIESYEAETKNLHDAIIELSKQYKFDLEDATVVGFSNGANIALGLIQDYPELINNYILFSPDYINKNKGFTEASGMNVFISTAKNDPYTSFSNIEELISELENAQVTVKMILGNGHQLTYAILDDAISWYNSIK